MSFENTILLVMLPILFAVALYFAGVQRKKLRERNRQEEEREQRINELIDKKANQYLKMERIEDSGPSALAKVNLDELCSDELIRRAIEKIGSFSRYDPWSQQGQFIENINLCDFFEFVHENKINLAVTKVEEAVKRFCKSIAI